MTNLKHHLSDPLIMWEALGPDGYPNVKGSPNTAFYHSPIAREQQRQADSKRDALILSLVADGKEQELGGLLIEQAQQYAKSIER